MFSEVLLDSILTTLSLFASSLFPIPPVYFQSASPDAHALLTASIPTIQTLIKGCKLVSVLSSDETSAIPEGCGSAVVSSSVVVYTLVKVSSPQYSHKASPLPNTIFLGAHRPRRRTPQTFQEVDARASEPRQDSQGRIATRLQGNCPRSSQVS